MPHVLIKYAHVLICISAGEGSRHFSAFHSDGDEEPVNNEEPVIMKGNLCVFIIYAYSIQEIIQRELFMILHLEFIA